MSKPDLNPDLEKLCYDMIRHSATYLKKRAILVDADSENPADGLTLMTRRSLEGLLADSEKLREVRRVLG